MNSGVPKWTLLLAAGSLATAPAAAEIIYDTLWITDTHAYDAANGNAWSGAGLFGSLFDLQLADDFEVPEGLTRITAVTGDFLNFLGPGYRPHDGVLVQFYEDISGRPSEEAYREVLVTGADLLVSGFDDTVFSLFGTRLEARLDVELYPGIWWVDIQPKDLGSFGDWYYQVRDLDGQIAGDTHARDGGRANGGYGHDWWRATGDDGLQAGTAAMRVQAIPEPSAWAMFGCAALLLSRGRARTGALV